MDFGLISIAIATGVGILQLLNYLNTKSARAEVSLDKFAKAERVTAEIDIIRDNIDKLYERLEDHADKINELRTQNAVCINQHDNAADNMERQLEALNKLVSKLEDLE